MGQEGSVIMMVGVLASMAQGLGSAVTTVGTFAFSESMRCRDGGSTGGGSTADGIKGVGGKEGGIGASRVTRVR
jgi:hypothetical protein